MATNIPIAISDNMPRITLGISGSEATRSLEGESGSPYYVGARAYVEQTENGATITITDKDGTTTATVHNGEKGDKGEDATIEALSNQEIEDLLND